LGGHEGNRNESVIEGDFSGWLFLHSQHPIKLSFSSIFPAAVAHEYRSAKRLQRVTFL
jgi:hypothetical protein